jgi:lipid II isoglutaminyl synthase (glutamine-hydrolysing)
MRPLRLVWIYPDLLSTYGDRGNVLVLERRARLRGIPTEVIEVNSDQQVPTDGDIYLMGGGEDLPQTLATRRLLADGGLHAAADRGAVLFAVCAGYQMMGVEFGGADDTPVQGLGLLDIRSGRGERRAVGEIVADVDPGLNVGRLTGFENHQGVTRLGPGVRPLARTEIGTGNGDGTEGSYAGRVLGTYLHGPALVRNPNLADLLLFWAVGPLPPFPPQAEELANRLRAERLAAAVPQLSSRRRAPSPDDVSGALVPTNHRLEPVYCLGKKDILVRRRGRVSHLGGTCQPSMFTGTLSSGSGTSSRGCGSWSSTVRASPGKRLCCGCTRSRPPPPT